MVSCGWHTLDSVCFLNHPLWPGRWSHPRLKAALFGSRGRRDVFFHQERAGEKACKENPHPVRELRDSTEMGLVSLVIAEDVVVQSLSLVRLFVTPWTAALQASLSIQPSHPLSPSSPSAFNLSQHQGFIPQRTGYYHQVAKVLELQFQHQSFQ